jgi:hypothetical protein
VFVGFRLAAVIKSHSLMLYSILAVDLRLDDLYWNCGFLVIIISAVSFWLNGSYQLHCVIVAFYYCTKSFPIYHQCILHIQYLWEKRKGYDWNLLTWTSTIKMNEWLYCLKIEVESDWQDYKGHVLDIVGECILKKLSLECDWSKIFQFGWYGSHKESGVSGFGALWLVPRLKGLTNEKQQCV